MIELKNVTKYYINNGIKQTILEDFSIKLPTNKNIGILGRNGAGKSTLLKMLAKIEKPNSGKIIFNENISWPMGIGNGFQGSMTGKENIKFVCRVYGLSDKEIRRAIDFIKEFSELGEYLNVPIKKYSSGMKSRLSFSLSLVFDFDYLIIDETLSVGDQKFQEKSKQAIKEKINKSNVLLVSHSMSILEEICDCGIYLDNGKIQFFENIKDAIQCYQKNI